MKPPPPSSPPFPYTTLFRSQPVHHETPGQQPETISEKEDRRQQSDAGMLANQAELQQKSLVGQHADRKSTRLNSSHVSISYAVFCLKKKMMTSEMQLRTRHR